MSAGRRPTGRTRLRVSALAAVAVLLIALAAASSSLAGSSSTVAKTKAPKPVTDTVAVKDDYYAPKTVKLKEGDSINWVWDKNNYDTHNVTLLTGPKGVSNKAFTSINGASGIIFKRQFLKPGTYHFQCTLHPESMNMTVVVTAS